MDLARVGPVGIRRFHLEKKCQENKGHKHNYDHTTIIIRGPIEVIFSDMVDEVLVEVERKEYYAGQAVFISANRYHTIKALVDDALYMCVFSHRDFDGLVTQTYCGNPKAYV